MHLTNHMRICDQMDNKNKIQVTIWDLSPKRIYRISNYLKKAMIQLDIEGQVCSMSEPPLLGRMGVIHKIPVLEIDGLFWNIENTNDISFDMCICLLSFLKKSYSNHGRLQLESSKPNKTRK